MEDKQPITKAAMIAKVSRTSIWAWVRQKEIRSWPGPFVRNLRITLVSVAEVKARAAQRPYGKRKRVKAEAA